MSLSKVVFVVVYLTQR